jgi:hypothetical protein
LEWILGEEYPVNLYYAYGIRNSYGLDFDPVSGKLWETENGPQSGDKINLVEPGFNGGLAQFYTITPSGVEATIYTKPPNQCAPHWFLTTNSDGLLPNN